MMRLAAWTPTDADSATLSPHSTNVIPQETVFGPVKTACVPSKNQMGKFPFMREEENKKTNKLLRRVISRS
jgi:hypothetical protein